MMYALMAREVPRAVIFRRGPTRHVLLLSWNLETDEIVPGQWFKGRIYERRCDLSPDGELLIYFAAKYKAPLFSWSAISKPPYFTALALWPKGDGWGGGGLFETRRRVALNHRPPEMALADGFRLPKSLTVHPLGQHSGWGEDDPIWSMRLEREGWVQTSAGKPVKIDPTANVWVQFEPPNTWEKRHPSGAHTLQMNISGIKERNGRWYRTEYRVGGAHFIADWADWSPKGELLFARDFSLYRLPDPLAPLGEAREIINLANATFAERPAPPEAQRWF